jgi:hypothetical protein
VGTAASTTDVEDNIDGGPLGVLILGSQSLLRMRVLIHIAQLG